MKRQTVKTRIFIANAWMIFVTIALVGLINIGVIKSYLYSQLAVHRLYCRSNPTDYQRGKG